MKRAVLVFALLAVLVGSAWAFDSSPAAAPSQTCGPALSGVETGFSLIGKGVIEEPGPTCQWIYLNGRWIQICF